METDLVFEYLNPFSNNKLSKISGEDLQDIIILINNYYLRLRKTLDLDENITFGTEIESEHAKEEKIKKELKKIDLYNHWRIKEDSSLDDGIEITSPILTDTIYTWSDLESVCQALSKYSRIGPNSGGHIHFGTQTLGDKKEYWLNFIKLWSVYENIIFRFTYGDYVTSRPSLKKYSKPISSYLWHDYETLKKSNASLEEIIHRISRSRYQAVNFNNVETLKCTEIARANTIEFRCPNGSLNEIIWQNNINLFAKMLASSKSNNLDDDIISKRHKQNSQNYQSLDLYDEIYLEEALEFCDIIFQNNLDKIYFLRQYLKAFQVPREKEKFVKSRELTKKAKGLLK